jgi:hypothetical protein
MPGKRGKPLSDEQKAKIREYIDAKKLHGTPRETLAAMIIADLGIEISGVSAARIRREAFEDKDAANSQKEAAIREVVLEHVEVEAPKVLGYIQDEIKSLRSMAYGDKEKGLLPEEMTVTERVRVSSAILASCKTLIEIIGPPKPDRHITTTLEILETADVSEFMQYGDKDHGPDSSEVADPKGDQAS